MGVVPGSSGRLPFGQRRLDLVRRSASRSSTRGARRRSRRRRWRTRWCAAGPSRRAARGTRAPPNASPAPRPLTTSTGNGGTSTRSSRVAASTPLGPCLTMARSRPRSSRASAARCGSVSPTATSHSSRLPTATVTCSRALPTCSLRVGRVGPEHRPVVEVEDGVRRGGRGPPRRRSGCRAAGSCGQTGDRGPVDPRVADRVEVRSSAVISRSGAFGVAVEVQREVVRREDLAERDRGRQAVDRRADVRGRRHRAAQRSRRTKRAERVVAGAGDHRATVWPCRAAATATFVALPPRNFSKVRTSSSPTPCSRG